MALKDLLALADKKLQDVFHTKAYDPGSDRERTILRIEDQRAKFLATEPAKGKKDFVVQNKVVQYSPVVPRAGALVIAGETTHYIPSERFTDFLDVLKTEIANGNLDRELEAAHSEESKAAKSTRSARAPREGGGKGWSEERRAAYAATIAARKAAKGQGA
ncbi:hypothetical protein [Sphingomonas sanguinis]|uniref:Uncharacterized protein n=1 Tax=Sphingomonas sanguinis TaxID=33051 RepID=A0A147IT27_9SPHN|nr:hypothetical protein [Sphingomonas sanguinis]KTT98684.1 hypothetical protein SB4_10560 [Sphingomonas sanguinis]